MAYKNKSIRTMSYTLALTTALSSSFLATAVQAQEAEGDDEEIEEIIVTSSKMNRKLEDVAGSVAVVTSADIDNQMAADLNQLFKNEPGVSVTGNSGGSQNIVIRGMSGDRVLMIKDGMRMNEGYGADGANDIVGRGFIDLDTIKQVEVAKGPASSLYGADAMGGIVVFTTKDASDYLDDDDTLFFGAKTAYTGVNDEVLYGGTAAGIFGSVESLLSVTKRDGGQTQNFYDEKSNKDVDSISVLAKLRFNINDSDYFSLSYDLWDQNAYTPDAGTGDYGLWLGISGYLRTYIDSHADARTEAYKASYHYEGDKIETFDVSFYRNTTSQVDGSVLKLDIDSGFTSDTNRQYTNTGVYDQDTYGFLSNMVSSFNIGGLKNEYAIGLDVEQTTSGRVSTEIRSNQDGEYKNEIVDKFPGNKVKRFGVYFSDYIELFDDRLTVNVGTRFDSFKMTPDNLADAEIQYDEISKSRLSSNAGVVFTVNEQLSLVGTFSQGYKVPPYDLAYIYHDNSFVAFPYYGYIVYPAENLEPETSNSFEIGVRVNTEKLNFSAYAFQNNFKNFIEIEVFDSEYPYPSFAPNFLLEHTRYQNIASVKIKGMEASLSYQLTDDLRAYTNVAFQDGKDQSTGEYINTISPLGGTVGLSYYTGNYGIDASMRWAKKMKKVNDGQYVNPGFAVVDMTSYYNIKESVTLRFGIFNLFNKRYTEYASVSSRAEGANTDNQTRPGRNITARISVGF